MIGRKESMGVIVDSDAGGGTVHHVKEDMGHGVRDVEEDALVSPFGTWICNDVFSLSPCPK